MAPGRPLIKQESKKQLLSLTVRNGRIRPKISVPRRKRPLLLQKAPSKKRTIYCTPWRGDWRSKRGAVTLPENHPKRILPSLRQEAVETDERIAELQDIQNDCVNITELAELRKRIKIIDQQLHNRFLKTQPHPPCTFDIEQHLQPVFSAEEYKRYGRQMILPGFGLKSQLKLQNSSVLIVGLGGLGCPAAAYIVGAGVRDVGLMDGDEVEVSNLHRQTLHTTGKLGTKKVESAMRYLNDINPNVAITQFPYEVDAQNAVSHFKRYDLILDCTDKPATRYLISDAAVLARKPLISASALGREGQLLILNNPPAEIGTGKGGFCYRCVFPRPPPAEAVLSCGEGGILGPVVGTIGTMMATHAINLLTRDEPENSDASQTFWVYNPFSNSPLRSIQIKGKREGCVSCSTTSTLTEQGLLTGEMQYERFCGLRQAIHIVPESSRTTPIQLTETFKQVDNQRRVLFDVQEPQYHSIASLPLAHNLPLSKLNQLADLDFTQWSEELLDEANILQERLSGADEVFFICRHGNDSQVATKSFQKLLEKNSADCSFWKPHSVQDVAGGVEACRRDLGLSIPEF